MRGITTFAVALLASLVAPEVASAAEGAGLVGVGAGLAIGLAVLGAGIAQGLTVANTVQGIARNPGASGSIQTPMIIGLAFIESLALFAFVIAFLVQGQIGG